MFDVFDIQFVGLPKSDRVEIRPVTTAFGDTAEQYVFIDGYRLGEIIRTVSLYPPQNAPAWLSEAKRNECFVLLVAGVARSADDPVSWGAFVRALETLLVELRRWRAVCESDCDQYELEYAEVTVQSFLATIEDYRAGSGDTWPLALVGTCAG